MYASDSLTHSAPPCQFVKVTTTKLRTAYETARKSLNEKKAQINFSAKASEDKTITSSADSVLKKFSNTVKDFKKVAPLFPAVRVLTKGAGGGGGAQAAGTMSKAGKSLFDREGKDEESSEMKEAEREDKKEDKSFEKTADKEDKTFASEEKSIGKTGDSSSKVSKGKKDGATKSMAKATKGVDSAKKLVEAVKDSVDDAVSKASVGLSSLVGKHSKLAKVDFGKAMKQFQSATSHLKGKFSKAKFDIKSASYKIESGLKQMKLNAAKLSSIFSKSKSSKSSKVTKAHAKKIASKIHKHANSASVNLAKLTKRMQQVAKKSGLVSKTTKSNVTDRSHSNTSHLIQNIHDIAIRDRATTRNSGRRVQKKMKKDSKKTKKLITRLGKDLEKSTEETKTAMHNSFRDLDSALSQLKDKLSTSSEKKTIRRAGRRDRRAVKSVSRDMRRKWQRQSFRRLGKSERSMKKGIDRSIRNMQKSKRSSRNFRQIRENIRRKFDNLGKSMSNNRLKRLMRRQFSKGSTLRSGVRRLRKYATIFWVFSNNPHPAPLFCCPVSRDGAERVVVSAE